MFENILETHFRRQGEASGSVPDPGYYYPLLDLIIQPSTEFSQFYMVEEKKISQYLTFR